MVQGWPWEFQTVDASFCNFFTFLLSFRHVNANPLLLLGFFQKTVDAMVSTVPTLTLPL